MLCWSSLRLADVVIVCGNSCKSNDTAEATEKAKGKPMEGRFKTVFFYPVSGDALPLYIPLQVGKDGLPCGLCML